RRYVEQRPLQNHEYVGVGVAMRGCLNLFRALLLLLLTSGAGAGAGAQQPEPFTLTDEERAWIAEHPVIRVGVLRDVAPMEYMEDGKLNGLSSEYLDYLTRKTGLTFIHVPAGGIQERLELLLNKQVDLIAGLR